MTDGVETNEKDKIRPFVFPPMIIRTKDGVEITIPHELISGASLEFFGFDPEWDNAHERTKAVLERVLANLVLSPRTSQASP